MRFLLAAALLAAPAWAQSTAPKPAVSKPGVSKPAAAPREGGLSQPYIDPKYLTSVPFGSSSPWLQPWRAYSQTMPAAFFLDSLGIGMDASAEANDEAMCRHLARAGIRHGRVEIGWGSIEWDGSLSDGTRQRVARLLKAMRKHGIRPLILLNAHHGGPGPTRYFSRKLAAAARKGDTSVQLDDVSGLAIGYSGLRNLSDYIASEAIVTRIEGSTLSLSQPLPKDLGAAGASVEMSTLKYRPFGPPASPEYKATREGWKSYARVVCGFVRATLSEAQPGPAANDAGFDVEVWNELSFGSNFLTVNRYYKPELAKYDEDKVRGDVLAATVEVASEQPENFRGVRLCDGFSNTIPWPASSNYPPRVSAMSKHPYAGLRSYPEKRPGGDIINALGASEKPGGFYPAYEATFPEYYATWSQTESLLRDAAPLTTDIYRTNHGRLARVVDGQVLPVWTWFTEMGWAPDENGVTDHERALDLKAKTLARTWLFFNNKGVERIYPYAANARDLWLGVVRDDFIALSKAQPALAAAPGFDDARYFSPALRTLSRIASKMSEGLDARLAPVNIRPLDLVGVSDSHNHKQWSGDGTPAHPDLLNRDVLAWLPYQVNAHKWAVGIYVMTRDVRHDLPPERYTLSVRGLSEMVSRLSLYDPWTGRSEPVQVLERGNARKPTRISLLATDFPRLLMIEELPY